MRALLLATLLVLAGCAAPLGTDAPPTPTGSCMEERKPTPTADGSDVDAQPYPDPPATFSTDSVREYVEAYESALLRNDALAGQNLSYLEVYVEDLSVTRRGDMYVVRLQSYTNGGYYEREGEGTPIVVHWDGAPTPASYLVTEDRLVRAESDGDDHVSLARLRNGTTLECF
ncbi:MAG: hypothetical protein V5A56_08510 [Halolamina sp.]